MLNPTFWTVEDFMMAFISLKGLFKRLKLEKNVNFQIVNRVINLLKTLTKLDEILKALREYFPHINDVVKINYDDQTFEQFSSCEMTQKKPDHMLNIRPPLRNVQFHLNDIYQDQPPEPLQQAYEETHQPHKKLKLNFEREQPSSSFSAKFDFFERKFNAN